MAILVSFLEFVENDFLAGLSILGICHLGYRQMNVSSLLSLVIIIKVISCDLVTALVVSELHPVGEPAADPFIEICHGNAEAAKCDALAGSLVHLAHSEANSVVQVLAIRQVAL